MKKNIIKAAFVAAFALVAGYGVYTAKTQVNLSDIALDNVEALAAGETSEEFYEKTGCEAVWDNVTCRGKDGNLHSYAKRK